MALSAGCLPSSCQRTASRAVSSADSLSRQIAAATAHDTLQLDGILHGDETRQLRWPRTVLFGVSGQVLVSDAQRNSLFTFGADQTLDAEVTWPGASVPYLVGLMGDTAIVFSPGTRQIDHVVRGAAVRTVSTPDTLPPSALQYVAATRSLTYLKAAGKDMNPFVAILDAATGTIRNHRLLTGSVWRHAGPLRVWGDSLLSLSGFFPVVDVMTPSLDGPQDSLVLVGFDSPMLARTYAFAHGEGRGAPLLMSSAAAAGPFLFVLNIRPGWLQVDVYLADGHLTRILLQPQPGYNRDFYPIDLAARQSGDSLYHLAVAVVQPEPQVQLYSWHATLPGAPQ